MIGIWNRRGGKLKSSKLLALAVAAAALSLGGIPRAEAVTYTWQGTPGSIWSTNPSDANWAGPAYFQDGGVASFNDVVGSTDVQIVGTVMPSNISMTSSINYKFSGTGAIAGASAFTKTGTGTLSIENTGVNTFTANLYVWEGTLQIKGAAASTALGDNANNLILDNATFRVSADASSSHAVALNHTNSAMSVDAGFTFTQTGAISGLGVLNATGMGTLVLTANNTLQGQVLIKSGTVQVPTLASAGTAQPLGTNGTPVVIGTSTPFSTTKATLAYSGPSTNLFFGIPLGSGGGGIAVTSPTTILSIGLVTITGAGDLHIFGPGQAYITAANTFTGQSIVESGTLRVDSFSTVGNSQPLGRNANPLVIGSATPFATTNATYMYGGNSITMSLPISLGSGGGAIAVGNSVTTLTVNSVVSGGALFVSGPNTLLLAGANTYTGTTTVNGGTLRVTGSIASPTVIINAGGRFLGGATLPGQMQLAGGTLTPHSNSSSTASISVGSFIATNGSSINPALGASGVNDRIIVSGTATLSGTITVAASLVTGYTGGVYPIIDAAGGVTSTANFLVTGPSASHAYYFTNSGTQLLLNASSSLPLVWTGATNNNWSNNNNTDVNWSGTINYFTTNADVTFDDSVGAGSRNINVVGTVTPKSITVGGSGDYTFGGSGTISGSLSFIKNGAGTLTISNTTGNTFTGTIAINAGTLWVNSSSIGSGTSTLTMAGSTLRITGSSLTSNRPLAMTGGAIITVDSGAAFIQAGIVSGTGDLIANGQGSLVLSGANTYTGQTLIQSGTVRADIFSSPGNNQSLGKNANPVVIGTSTPFAITNATLFLNAGSATVSIPAQLGSGGGGIRVNGNVTFQGVISGGDLIAMGDSSTTLNLTGSNTFTGQTLIKSGNVGFNSTLAVGSAQPLGKNANPVVIGSSLPFATTGAALVYTSSSQATSNLPIAIDTGGGAIATSAVTIFTQSGPITGSGPLTIKGVGSIVITGPQLYSGSTLVTSYLAMQGSFATSDVTVSSGGTLAGTASFSAPLSVTNLGTLSPHTSSNTSATLSVGSFSAVSGAKLNFNLGAPGSSDLLVSSGSTTLSGTIPITFNAISGIASGDYTFINAPAGLTSTATYQVTSPAGYLVSVTPTATALTAHVTTLNYSWRATTNSNWSTAVSDSNWSGELSYFVNTGNVTFDDSVGAGSRTISVVGTVDTSGITVAGNGNYTLNAAGAGLLTGIGGLIKNGPGTLTINLTNNSITGAVSINAGTVQIKTLAAFGTGSSAVTLGNAVLQVTETFSSSRQISLADANSVISIDATKTYAQSGGKFTGPGTLNLSGAGTLVLSANNDFLGQTLINSGSVQVATFGAAGTAQPLGANLNPVVIGNSTPFATTNATLVYNGNNGTSGVPIALGSGGGAIAVVGSNNLFVQSGVISGAGNLYLTGTQFIALLGSNTFTGQTIIQSGTLRISTMNLAPGANQPLGKNLNPVVIGSSTPYATTGATLTYDSSTATSTLPIAIGSGGGAISVFSGTNLTLSGGVTGGPLTYNGPGTLTLTGVNTYANSTTINAGTLVLSGSLPNSGVTVNTGTLIGGGSMGGTLTVNSGGAVTPHTNSSSLATLSVGGNFSAVAGSIFNVAAGAPGNSDLIQIAGSATLSGAQTWNLSQISGFGAGDFTLLNATGGITSTATYTVTNPAGYIGSISKVGNTLQLHVIANEITWRGTASANWGTNTDANWVGTSTTFSNGASVTFDDTVGAGPRSIAISSTVSPFNVNVNSTDTYTFTGSLSINASAALTKSGSGTLTINNTAANTFTAVNINGGTLTIGGGASANALGSLPVINLNAATLRISRPNATIVGTVLLGNAASAIAVDSGSAVSFNAVVSGTGNLNAVGTGTLVVNGTNDFTGQTIIQTGTVMVQNFANAGVAQPVGKNANPLVIGTATPYSTSNATLYWGSGAGTITFPVAIGSGGGAISSNSSSTLNVSGVISGGDLFATGTATLYLNAANTFTGKTIIQTGAVRVDSFAAVGTPQPLGTNATPVVIGTAAPYSTSNARLLFGGSTNVSTDLPIVIAAGGGGIGNISSARTLTLVGNVSGGPLTIANAGTVALQGTHTVSAVSVASGSTLLLNGTLSNASVIVTGAFLANGSIAGSLSVNSAGAVTPHTSSSTFGTLNVGGSVSALAGSIFNFAVAAPGTSDLLNVTGAVSLSGAQTWTPQSQSGFAPGVYNLVTATGGISSTATLTVTQINGYDSTLAIDVTGTQLNLTVVSLNETWTGATNSNWTTNATDTNWTGTYNYFKNGANVTFDDSVGAGPRTINLPGNIITNSINVAGSGNYTFSGAGSISGVNGLIKNGAGTLTISNTGSSNFSGNITMNGGTLYVIGTASASALGSSSNPIALNAGTLQFGTTHTDGHPVSLGSANTSIVVDAGAMVTFSTGISGSFDLNINNVGTLVLAPTNSYTGQTRINSGTVRSTTFNPTSFGTNVNPVVIGTSTSFATTNATIELASSSLTYAQPVAIGSGGGGVSVLGTAKLTFSNVVSGSGDIYFSGPGTLELNGSNTLSGRIFVKSGTLMVGSFATVGNAQPLGTNANPVLVGTATPYATTLATLRYTGGSTTTAMPITYDSGGGAFYTSSSLTLNGAISGGPLYVTGSGSATLTLGGTTTVSSISVISGGLLNITAPYSGTVNATTGTLGGTSSIGGLNLTGTVKPRMVGTTPTTFTIGALTSNSGATFAMTLGATSDLVQVNSATLAGTLNIAINSNSVLSNNVFTIISSATPITSTATYNVTGPTGYSFLAALDGGGTNLQVTVQQINFSWRGTTNSNWSTAASDSNWVGSGTAFVNGGFSTFDDSVGAGPRSVTLVGNLISLITVDGTGDYTFGGTGALTSNSSLIKNGAGTLTITSTANTYTGSTTINAGKIKISHAAALGSSGNSIIIGNGTLQVAATLSTSRQTSLTNANSAISVDAGVVFTHAGQLSGTGALNKIGPGILNLSNSNSFSGGLIIQAGTVQSANYSSSFGAPSTTITLGTAAPYATTNATLEYTGTGSDTPINILVASGGGAVKVTTSSANYGVYGLLTGSGNLYLPGPGNFGVSNTSNTFSGQIIVQGGGLRVSSFAAVGVNPNPIVLMNGASLRYNGSSATPVTTPLTLGVGGGTIDQGLANAQLNFNGIISGNADLTLNGSIMPISLGGANTFTGQTFIRGNVYIANLTTPVGTPQPLGTNANPVVISSAAGSGTLLYSGATATSSLPIGIYTSGGTLNVNTPGVVLTYTGSITGGPLSIAGAGVFSYAGSSAGTGAVTVTSSGTLNVAGTLANAVNVSSSGTLGGPGTINGAVTISGKLQPTILGSSPTTLTLGSSLTMNSGATMNFNLGATSDLVNVGTTLNISGSQNIIVNGGTGSGMAGDFTLISAGISITNTASYNIIAPIGYGYTVDVDVTGKLLQLHSILSSLTWTAATNSNWSTNASDTNWTGSSAYFTTGSTVTFDDSVGAGSRNVILNGTLSAAVNVNGTGDYTFMGAGSLGGISYITKNGTGTLSIAATVVNNFIGGVTINGGKIQIYSENSLSVGSSPLTINAGTLQVSAVAGTSTRLITVGDAASAISVDAGFTYNTTGVISGAGNLNATGQGTLVLSGVNTFTGQTIIKAGTVSVATIAAPGTAQPLGKNASPLVIGTPDPLATTNATFNYTGVSATTSMGIQIGSGGGIINMPTSGVALKIGGNITGGPVTIKGPGLVTFTGSPKTYTGGTNIVGGNLAIDSNSSINTSNVTITNNGSLHLYGHVPLSSDEANWVISSGTNPGVMAEGLSVFSMLTYGGTIDDMIMVDLGANYSLTKVAVNWAFPTGNPSEFAFYSAPDGATNLYTSPLNDHTPNDGTSPNTMNMPNWTLDSAIFTTAATATGDTFYDLSGNSARYIALRVTGAPNYPDIRQLKFFTTATVDSNFPTLTGDAGTTLEVGYNLQLNVGSANTDSTFSGNLTGAGTFVKVGTAALTLAGNSTTFTGDMLLQRGTIKAGASSTLTAGRLVFGTATTAGTLDLNGFSPTVGSIAIAAGATAANQIISNSSTTTDSILTISSTTPSTFNGKIQDAIAGGNKTTGIAIAANTTLTLTAANNYTGPTSITGTLVVSAALGNTPVTVNVGGTLSGTSTIAGAVTVYGKLQPRAGAFSSTLVINSTLDFKDGATLAMTVGTPSDLVMSNGITSFAGAQSISVARAASGFGPGDFTLLYSTAGITTSSVSFTVDGPTGFAYSAAVDGSAHYLRLHVDALAQTWLGNTNSNWSNNASDANWSGSPASFQTNAAVTFDDTVGAGSRNIILSGSLRAGITVAGAGDYWFVGGGSIGGPSSITKTGAGTLLIANDVANTFTGGVIISGGAIRIAGIGANSALGVATSPVTINNAMLQIGVSGVNLPNPISLANANSAINVEGAATFTQSGLISGDGNLNATGTGTLILTAANTFTGQTLIQSGTVQVPSLAPAGTVQPVGINANPIVVGTATPYATSSATFAYAGALPTTTALPIAIGAGGGAIAITNAAADLKFTGAVTGGPLTIKGLGRLTFTSSPKTYTGGTNIANLGVTVENSSALGSGPVALSNNAVLRFTLPGAPVAMPTADNKYIASSSWPNGSMNPATIAQGISAFWQVGAGVGGLVSSNGQPDFVMIDLGANYALGSVTINWNEAGVNPRNFAFYVAPDGATNLYNSPTGKSNPLYADGGLTNPNTLNLANWTLDSALYTSASPSAGNYTFDLLGNTGRYIALQATLRGPLGYGFRITQMSLSGVGSGSQNIDSLAGTAGTNVQIAAGLTLNVGAGNANTSFDGLISGGGTFSKVGSGTQTLTGANTYIGGTSIVGGTLKVANTSGSATGTGAVTLLNGTLASAAVGSVAGSVFAESSTTIAPGGLLAIGTLNIGGSLNVKPGSKIDIDGNGDMTDLLLIAGNLNFNNAGDIVNLNIHDLGGAHLAFPFTLVTFAGSNFPLSILNFNITNDIPNTGVALNGNSIVLIPTSCGCTPPGDGTWNGASSNDWALNVSMGNNWMGARPDGTGYIATFNDSAASGPTMIKMSGNRTLGGLEIASTGSYSIGTLATSDKLIFNNNASGATITAKNGGAHTVNAQIVLNDNATIETQNSTSLTLVQGIDNAAGKSITLKGTGPIIVGNIDGASGATSQQLAATGAINLPGDVAASATRVRTAVLNIGNVETFDHATLKIVQSSPTYAESPDRPAGNNAFVSVVQNINIYRNDTSSPFMGTLDITNNDIIIDYTSTNTSLLSKIEEMVKSGYNSGTWTGTGITSSVAAANPGLFTVAVADNQQLGGVAINNFDGIDTTSHKQILVKFTWIADINLDGLVNANDAIAFATFYSEGLTGVHHQTDDLNYDGTVNFNDAIMFATTYNASLQSLPEPASLTVLALGATALLMRRRK